MRNLSCSHSMTKPAVTCISKSFRKMQRDVIRILCRCRNGCGQAGVFQAFIKMPSLELAETALTPTENQLLTPEAPALFEMPLLAAERADQPGEAEPSVRLTGLTAPTTNLAPASSTSTEAEPSVGPTGLTAPTTNPEAGKGQSWIPRLAQTLASRRGDRRDCGYSSRR